MTAEPVEKKGLGTDIRASMEGLPEKKLTQCGRCYKLLIQTSEGNYCLCWSRTDGFIYPVPAS